jgi:hypothetical protein
MSDLETLEKVDIPDNLRSTPAPRAWRWQWLIAPIMGISIVLHVVLLFVPIPTFSDSEQEEAIEEEPEADEEEVIDILSLSDIAAPEPPPEPPAEAPPQESPPSQPLPPDAVPPPPDPAQAEQLPVDDPIDDSADEGGFDDPLPVDDGAEDPAPPPFDPGPSRDVFIGNISNLGVQDYSDNIQDLDSSFFKRPGSAPCFLDPGGGLVPSVRTANWVDKSPQTLMRENFAQGFGGTGITFEELAPFCGEKYFQAFTAAGEPFMKFSMVEMQGSTVLVMWDTPPQ